MRKEYGIGSLHGGLLQPIQQHTWDVTWAIDDPREGSILYFVASLFLRI